MDEQLGLFREIKKLQFFKNERKKKYYRLNDLEKTIVVILNERMFRKIF